MHDWACSFISQGKDNTTDTDERSSPGSFLHRQMRGGGGGRRPSQIHMRRKSSFQVVYQKDWASVSNNKFAFDCSPNPAFAIPNILIKEMSQASSSRVGGWWVGKDAGRGHAGLLLGVGCCGGGGRGGNVVTAEPV